jgi:hypothetical protein
VGFFPTSEALEGMDGKRFLWMIAPGIDFDEISRHYRRQLSGALALDCRCLSGALVFVAT